MLKCACQFKSLIFLRAHVVNGIIIGSANTKRSGLRGKIYVRIDVREPLPCCHSVSVCFVLMDARFVLMAACFVLMAACIAHFSYM